MRKFLSLILIVALTGCGYTTSSMLPSNFQKIYIPPFENKVDYMNQVERKIYIPGLETKVLGVVIDRYLFDGNLRIGDQDNADLILKGKLLSFDREDLRLTENEDVKEYRLRVTVSLVLQDSEGNIVWQEPSFSGESTYYTSGPLVKSESTAIDEALTDLALRIVARTIEDW